MTIGEALELLSRETKVERVRDGPAFRLARVTLPNGNVLSIGYGTGHYSSMRWKREANFDQTTDIELVIFREGERFACLLDEEVSLWGWVPVEHLLRVIDAVALYQEGGPCPCPDCLWEGA